MFVDAPTTSKVRKVGYDHLRGVGESVVAIVDRDPDAIFAEPNDVSFPVPCRICKEADVFGGKPAPCILSKVLDDKEGLDAVGVTQDNDPIETEANDVGEAGAGSRY